MEWSELFDTDGYYTILFQILITFIMGIIFSPFSMGFFLFIVVYLLFELFYAYRRGFKYDGYEALARVSIFLWGLLGFLFGRWALGDNDPLRFHYDTWSL